MGTKTRGRRTPARRPGASAGAKRAAQGASPKHSGIAAALFTSTQQRVLGLLYGQPGRQFYASELFRLARAGRGAVQRELAKLAASGLVSVTTVGRQKHYQANAAAPIFDELRAIIVKTVGVADPVREALAPLAARITRALIFGSVAKGTDRAGSDVDVLVVADELTLEEVFSALARAEAVLDRKVSPTLVDREEFERARRIPDSFIDRLLRGPTLPLIGTVA